MLPACQALGVQKMCHQQTDICPQEPLVYGRKGELSGREGAAIIYVWLQGSAEIVVN